MSELGFDINDEQYNDDGGGDYGPLPKGEYVVTVDASEVKKSKAGANYLVYTYKVLGPTHENRLLWDNLNLWHPNDKPRDIARGTLRKIAHACGVQSVDDSRQLLGKKMRITVDVRPGNGDYGPSNTVKKYAAVDGASQSAPQPQGQQQASNDRPWG